MANSFADELSVFVSSLHEPDRELFSSPVHWMILANGDADFHDNVIFFGFEDDKTEPVLIAKVPRLIENGWMLKMEYDHLIELWKYIGEAAVRYVPRPYTMTTLQGRPVLIISYIPGDGPTRLSGRSFWGNSEQVAALAREAARSLRELNNLTENPIEVYESIDSNFQKKVDKFRELFQVTGDEDRELSELVGMVNKRARQASHKVLIQGDFWHGNMIRDEKRGKLMFIDWQFARWSVDVSMDVYFFLLAGALAATGQGPVDERAKRAFQILIDWRANVIPDYLSTYGKPERYVLLPEKYGMIVCCVEKAVRSTLEFNYRHPDDLMWRYLFSELMHWPEGS